MEKRSALKAAVRHLLQPLVWTARATDRGEGMRIYLRLIRYIKEMGQYVEAKDFLLRNKWSIPIAGKDEI